MQMREGWLFTSLSLIKSIMVSGSVTSMMSPVSMYETMSPERYIDAEPAVAVVEVDV